MDALKEVSLKNEVFEVEALGGRDILEVQSASVFQKEHCVMHLSLWPSIPHGSLGLVRPALS